MYKEPVTQIFSKESVASITLPNGLRIDLSNEASTSLIHSLIGAASHVK